MSKQTVKNMNSPKSGNPVGNQFEIEGYDDNNVYFRIFQSYRSTIVKVTAGKVSLDERYWDYSRTTSKYRNQFLNETTAETKKKIASGEYTLTNLN